MIRLRPRIGVFRSLSVLVLLAGLVGGVLISDRKSQQRTTSNVLAVEAAAAPGVAPDGSDGSGRSADQKDAQTKADNAARAAAAQAKSADDAARNKAKDEANRSTSRGPSTGGNVGPIPASCQTYTGNQAIGCTLMLQAGYGLDQAPCLIKLWNRESGWRTNASNPSGAWGIPQAVPGNKMSSFGADWKTNPVTQIKWGLSYIKGRYKTPCGAWQHSQDTGWY